MPASKISGTNPRGTQMSQITKIPLEGEDRVAFIEAANEAFEAVVLLIEPANPKITKALWDPQHFLDRVLLKPDMLPIDREYALRLIDACMPHHVIDLAVEADKWISGTPPPVN